MTLFDLLYTTVGAILSALFALEQKVFLVFLECEVTYIVICPWLIGV